MSEQNDKIYELQTRGAIQEEKINNHLTKCDAVTAVFGFMVSKVTATKKTKI